MNNKLLNGCIEDVNGDKAYYYNGELHRLDGPALDFTNGYKGWFIYGNYLTKEEHEKYLKLKAFI